MLWALICCLQGRLAFITSNKFIRASYGKSLRRFLTTQTTIHALIDFGDLPVFEATAYPAIVITTKIPPTGDTEIQVLTVENLDILIRLPQEIDALAWMMSQESLPENGVDDCASKYTSANEENTWQLAYVRKVH